MNILILCTGNSARSIMLESIFKHRAKARVNAFSAGSKPVGELNLAVVEFLNDIGYDMNGFRSKSWDEFSGPDAPKIDLVITVCSNAANETCPVWNGAPHRAHWGVEDPAAVTEPPEAAREAAQAVYVILNNRAKAFLALDFEAMSAAELQSALNKIGQSFGC